VGSGIYYYSSQNITESLLQFRVAIEAPGAQQDFTSEYDLGEHLNQVC
jgi:hypothetical protein